MLEEAKLVVGIWLRPGNCVCANNVGAFTIDLLADPKHELLNAAGVGQSDYKGTMYWNRTSFVIDTEGVLRKIYEKVSPEGHERVLLDDIKAIQASSDATTLS